MIATLTAFLVAGFGVGAFMAIGLPLPWLLGPIIACLGAALLGVPMKGIKQLNDSMRTILGVAVGATMTTTVIASFPAMWPTLVLVPVMVIVIGLTGIPYFRRIWKFDPVTAYYSAMPGGLQDMLVFGEEAGGNVRTLSLVHATRVLVIVVILPVLLKVIWDADLSNAPGAPVRDLPMSDIILMIFCAGFGWWGAKRVGLFGASILGPLIVTAAVTITGFLENRPPAEAIAAAQFFIGMTIGTKYAGVTMAEVRRDLAAGFGFCLLLILLTIIFVEGILMTGLAPGREALLAFAPGGQAELTVLALVVGADVAFVVAHHVLRIIIVITGAPIVMRWMSAPPG